MVSPINEYTLEDNTVFSIEGKGLKLNTAEDVQPFVDTILQMDDLQEIRMSGNTIGVEAGKALAGALQSRNNIKVSHLFLPLPFLQSSLLIRNRLAQSNKQHRLHASNFCSIYRLPIFQIFSLVDFVRKSLRLSRLSVTLWKTRRV
jgi:hypothetical protein